ncbi:uncharacterized protein LOC136027294 isoform X2 [Artemia franciscana]|uniref:Uncharacterized protein n=1 Tax=Artemia franciscana TaxID=6661 RepID=A0AA88HCG6_ARTSF|nr:hypothetical protein QYM36_013213 [Artemia franciscana]
MMHKFVKYIETICIFVISLFAETSLIIFHCVWKQYAGRDARSKEDSLVAHSHEYDFHWTDSKPLLLCISVGPDAPLLWSRLEQSISHSFNVVPVTFEKHWNQNSSRTNFQLKTLANYCVDVAASLGVKDFSIVAHGMGIHMAWKVQQLYPKRVQKLIIISASHPSLSEEVQDLTWKGIMFSSQRYRCLSYLPYFSDFIFPFLSAEDLQYFRDLTISNCSLDEEQLVEVKNQLGSKGYYHSTINYLRNVSNPLRQLESRLDFGRISCPVLFIIGDSEGTVSFEDVCYSGQFVEKFHCKIIENCKGFPHWQYAEQVGMAISSFLSGTPTLPAPRKRASSTTPVKDIVSRALKGGASAVSSTMYSCAKNIANGTISTVLSRVPVESPSNLVKRGLF